MKEELAKKEPIIEINHFNITLQYVTPKLLHSETHDRCNAGFT